jgi:hypothetical protein
MTACIPITDVGHLLHAAANPFKVMALLLARFDESGTEGGRSVVAYAGYCAGAKTWARVEAAWQQALDDFGAPPFHMVDLLHSQNGFEKFDRHLIGLLLNKLKGILKTELDARRMVPLWSAIEKGAWAAATTPPEFAKRFPKPLDLCFDHLVHQMRRFSEDHADATPVAPMFADSPEYTARNEEYYGVYKRHPEWGAILGPIAFGSPRQIVALQTADMIAYETSAYWDRLDEGDYFRRIVELRYRPIVDEIVPVFRVGLSGCIGEAALRLIINDYLAGRPLWRA